MLLLEATLGSLIILVIAAFTFWFIRWVSQVDAAELAVHIAPSLTALPHPADAVRPHISLALAPETIVEPDSAFEPTPTFETEPAELRELIPA